MSSFDGFLMRYTHLGCRVVILPDPMDGSVSTGLTPEQADQLAERILALAEMARRERAERMPGLLDDPPKGKGGSHA